MCRGARCADVRVTSRGFRVSQTHTLRVESGAKSLGSRAPGAPRSEWCALPPGVCIFKKSGSHARAEDSFPQGGDLGIGLSGHPFGQEGRAAFGEYPLYKPHPRTPRYPAGVAGVRRGNLLPCCSGRSRCPLKLAAGRLAPIRQRQKFGALVAPHMAQSRSLFVLVSLGLRSFARSARFLGRRTRRCGLRFGAERVYLPLPLQFRLPSGRGAFGRAQAVGLAATYLPTTGRRWPPLRSGLPETDATWHCAYIP